MDTYLRVILPLSLCFINCFTCGFRSTDIILWIVLYAFLKVHLALHCGRAVPQWWRAPMLVSYLMCACKCICVRALRCDSSLLLAFILAVSWILHDQHLHSLLSVHKHLAVCSIVPDRFNVTNRVNCATTMSFYLMLIKQPTHAPNCHTKAHTGSSQCKQTVRFSERWTLGNADNAGIVLS